MRVDLTFAPGLVLDDTGFSVRQGGWVAADKVRFRLGRPEVIGGWEALGGATVDGICRGLLTWRDNSSALNHAIGTSEKLYVISGGDLFDITPPVLAAGLEDSTGGQGYGTGAYSIGLYSRPSTADFTARTWSMAAFGETLLANPSGGTIYQWSNDVAQDAASLGRSLFLADDLASYADQSAFDVVWTRGTGWSYDATDDEADCDGSQVAVSNLTRSVTGLTAGERYTVEIDYNGLTDGTIAALEGSAPGPASSEASGTVAVHFTAGSTSATVGAQGNADFIGSVSEMRVYRRNAPDAVTAISVPQGRRHVIAYGCSEEGSNDFNPRAIRWCDFENLSDWSTQANNNAGEYVLEGSGAIVGVLETAYGAFIWTTNELWFQTFIGAPDQTYDFTRLGTNCGLIGPNACAGFEGFVFWMSPDGGFWTCPAGGTPTRLTSPLEQSVRDELAFVQQAKVYASTVSQFREIWWFYPDKATNECSRYVSFQLDEGAWSAGMLARTAFIDSGAGPSPLAVDTGGAVYYHERGRSANGGPISWSLESGDVYVEESDRHLMFKGIRPDVEEQQGLANLEIITKVYPQGNERVNGPYAMTAGRDKIDFLATGRISRLKFYGNAAPCRFRLGRINLEIQTRGRQ